MLVDENVNISHVGPTYIVYQIITFVTKKKKKNYN